jgi:hypothetical protein
MATSQPDVVGNGANRFSSLNGRRTAYCISSRIAQAGELYRWQNGKVQLLWGCRRVRHSAGFLDCALMPLKATVASCAHIRMGNPTWPTDQQLANQPG